VTTLTAQEIAKRIQRPGEPLVAAVDRFRNWAKTGIIKPTGARNPGTGRKKRYSTDALLKAVILQTLVDSLGSPAASFSPMLGLIAEHFRKKAVSANMDLLVLSKEAGGSGFEVRFTNWKDLTRQIANSDHEIHTLIELGRIYERVMLEQGELP